MNGGGGQWWWRWSVGVKRKVFYSSSTSPLTHSFDLQKSIYSSKLTKTFTPEMASTGERGEDQSWRTRHRKITPDQRTCLHPYRPSKDKHLNRVLSVPIFTSWPFICLKWLRVMFPSLPQNGFQHNRMASQLHFDNVRHLTITG